MKKIFAIAFGFVLIGCVNREMRGSLAILRYDIDVLKLENAQQRDDIVSLQKKIDAYRYDYLLIDDVKMSLKDLRKKQNVLDGGYREIGVMQDKLSVLEKFKDAHDKRWPRLITK